MALERYLLLANDSQDVNGEKLEALSIAQRRMEKNCWELYQRTPHRRDIKEGDLCLIYLAGLGDLRQHVIAECTVKGNLPYKMREVDPALTDFPIAYLSFASIRYFEEPVSVKDCLDRLSFIPVNRSRWGAVMRSGCKRLNTEDYEVLSRGSPTRK